jgi:PadR family transcriptional regulator PadR
MTKEDTEISPPECCDMRGMLSFLILWLLSKRPMYGQELAEEINKRKGAKPNPGTIYPALKDLRKRALIQSKKEGRVTIYRITENGKKGIKKACEYFCRAYGEIFQEQNSQ